LRRLRQVLSDLLFWSSSKRTSQDTKVDYGELPKYNKNSEFKLKEVADVENLYRLIDILVRYKCLDLRQQGEGVTATTTAEKT
jgi:hypothetical protein